MKDMFMRPLRRPGPRYRKMDLEVADLRYVARKLLVQLERLVRRGERLETPLMVALCWVLGPEATSVVRELSPLLRGKRRRRPRDDDDDMYVRDSFMHSRRIPPVLVDDEALIDLVNIGRKDEERLRAALLQAIARRREVVAGKKGKKSRLRRNLRHLKRTLGLGRVGRDLLLLCYLVGACPAVGLLVDDQLGHGGPEARRAVAAMLGASDRAVYDALHGRLGRMGLLPEPARSLMLDPEFWVLLEESPDALMERNLFRRLPGGGLELSAFDMSDRVLRVLLRLLGQRPEDGAIHILLWGAPGSGKTTLVRAIIEQLGLRAYEVTTAEDSLQQSRRAGLLACLHLTNHDDGSVLVVDDADALLSTERHFAGAGEVNDHGWLNQLMDEPGARVVWIANEVGDISSAVMRRFAFSVHMPEPGHRQRQRQWQGVAERLGVAHQLGEDGVARLASDYPVTVGLMERAVLTATGASDGEEADLERVVRLALDSYIELRGLDVRAAARERVAEEFSLQALNVSCDVDALVADARGVDRMLREEFEGGPRGMSLLFHGPPGTGKSELARYLAGELGRELMILRASDLLNMFVGQTEKQIAGAFRRAEASGALLVFDEADTFLYSREGATHSWEVSFTNEFLTRMERFRGIMACTTNRLEGLDPASLRRFTHKVGFDHLTPDGVELLYASYLAPLVKARLKEQHRRELRRMERLTPGDFSAVRDRFAFRVPGSLGHGRLVAALREEARLKQIHNPKRAGFAC